jgi:hypothetical protein
MDGSIVVNIKREKYLEEIFQRAEKYDAPITETQLQWGTSLNKVYGIVRFKKAWFRKTLVETLFLYHQPQKNTYFLFAALRGMPPTLDLCFKIENIGDIVATGKVIPLPLPEETAKTINGTFAAIFPITSIAGHIAVSSHNKEVRCYVYEQNPPRI